MMGAQTGRRSSVMGKGGGPMVGRRSSIMAGGRAGGRGTRTQKAAVKKDEKPRPWRFR